MRLLFLSALYPPETRGGGEISTHLLARALVARGHSVTVVTAGAEQKQRQLDGVDVLEVPVALTAKPLFERRWARRTARRLAQLVPDAAQYDVVHAHDFRTAQVVSELGWERAVVTVRDYAQICGSPNNLLADGSQCPGCERLSVAMRNQAVAEAPLWRRPFRVWQYWHNVGYRLSSFRHFQYQVFISAAQREVVARRQDLNGVETHVIYNPVPAELLAAEIAPAEKKRIVYVGTIAHYKGVGLLLEAFRRLAGQDDEVELEIVGEGAQRAEYERQVDQWGLASRVTFTGRVLWDELPAVYDGAAVVAAPSIWIEPFGRTVAEALARGRVVVASNVGGPAEVIQGGVTGLLFERGSAAALEQQLSRALSFPEADRQEMGRAAQAWVREHSNPARIAQQHEQVYGLLAG